MTQAYHDSLIQFDLSDTKKVLLYKDAQEAGISGPNLCRVTFIGKPKQETPTVYEDRRNHDACGAHRLENALGFKIVIRIAHAY